jgi:hypothetical protein
VEGELLQLLLVLVPCVDQLLLAAGAVVGSASASGTFGIRVPGTILVPGGVLVPGEEERAEVHGLDIG